MNSLMGHFLHPTADVGVGRRRIEHETCALERRRQRRDEATPLFNDEWVSLDGAEKTRLLGLGLETRDLSGELVGRAAAYFNANRRLKLNDCFALVLAEDTDDSILLTGDALLRRIAGDNDVEARGVLWVADELETHGVASPRELHDALRLLHEDDLVFLPEDEIQRRIRRLSRLL